MNAQTRNPEPMQPAELSKVMAGLIMASQPGKVEDGTRIHVHYEATGKPSPKAEKEAMRADELGLARDRYTGRVSRIWQSATGDTIMTVKVELEREKLYRSLNVTKGRVFRFVVLGN